MKYLKLSKLKNTHSFVVVKDDKDSPSNGTNEFEWKQVGDDIIQTPVKMGRELKYTIVKRSTGEMIWKTYITGDFYIVEIQ